MTSCPHPAVGRGAGLAAVCGGGGCPEMSLAALSTPWLAGRRARVATAASPHRGGCHRCTEMPPAFCGLHTSRVLGSLSRCGHASWAHKLGTRAGVSVGEGRSTQEHVSRSVLSDSATPWTAACQAPFSMGFSRQEHWSGWPFPSPGKNLKFLSTCHAESFLSQRSYLNFSH